MAACSREKSAADMYLRLSVDGIFLVSDTSKHHFNVLFRHLPSVGSRIRRLHGQFCGLDILALRYMFLGR